jgi:hypothetical protein
MAKRPPDRYSRLDRLDKRISACVMTVDDVQAAFEQAIAFRAPKTGRTFRLPEVLALWRQFQEARLTAPRGTKLVLEAHASFVAPGEHTRHQIVMTDRLIFRREGARTWCTLIWRAALHAPNTRPRVRITACFPDGKTVPL